MNKEQQDATSWNETFLKSLRERSECSQFKNNAARYKSSTHDFFFQCSKYMQ